MLNRRIISFCCSQPSHKETKFIVENVVELIPNGIVGLQASKKSLEDISGVAIAR
jgi:hypothetical protein